MVDSGLLETFLAAIQASLSVLLVMLYGGIAAWMNILTPANTKAVSKICVQMFLPALLITKIGSELHSGSAGRYAIVLLWAVVCHLVSFVFGVIARRGFGMPDWTTAAVMFNNTTSYPLLLIAVLEETGVLNALVVGNETSSAAVERAKSYFLVFATVSHCLTFAIGPRLINSGHAPEPDKSDNDDEVDAEPTENTGLLRPGASPYTRHSHSSFLLSTRRPTQKPTPTRRPALIPKKRWARLGLRSKWWLIFVSDFLNAPLLGALVGALIGLTPPLHRAFFNPTEDSGIFTAWLTASLKNIGGLFVTLPVVVAGGNPTRDLQNENRQNGNQTKIRAPILFILVTRFVLWPLLSIGTIYLLASHTSLLGRDPMLWFALMLMPTGPPATTLVTLVQVSGASEEEKSISRILGMSYLVSPILSLTVVGSLRASQASI
ncbi:Auxin efflux carrier [Mycena sanguinolenta]|uniref:Auxin efflux carrier n=1 Tax=Mycena sanguinolenta TaxID=230812 RepID=A0A8H6YZS7_9AGAR|nr:Auxin efflux carrier [Mycena sanguinolenta]